MDRSVRSSASALTAGACATRCASSSRRCQQTTALAPCSRVCTPVSRVRTGRSSDVHARVATTRCSISSCRLGTRNNCGRSPPGCPCRSRRTGRRRCRASLRRWQSSTRTGRFWRTDRRDRAFRRPPTRPRLRKRFGASTTSTIAASKRSSGSEPARGARAPGRAVSSYAKGRSEARSSSDASGRCWKRAIRERSCTTTSSCRRLGACRPDGPTPSCSPPSPPRGARSWGRVCSNGATYSPPATSAH